MPLSPNFLPSVVITLSIAIPAFLLISIIMALSGSPRAYGLLRIALPLGGCFLSLMVCLGLAVVFAFGSTWSAPNSEETRAYWCLTAINCLPALTGLLAIPGPRFVAVKSAGRFLIYAVSPSFTIWIISMGWWSDSEARGWTVGYLVAAAVCWKSMVLASRKYAGHRISPK